MSDGQPPAESGTSRPPGAWDPTAGSPPPGAPVEPLAGPPGAPTDPVTTDPPTEPVTTEPPTEPPTTVMPAATDAVAPTTGVPVVPPDHTRIFQAAPPPPPPDVPTPPPAGAYAPGGMLAGRPPVQPYRERWNFAGGAVIGFALLMLILALPNLLSRVDANAWESIEATEWTSWVAMGAGLLAVIMLASGAAIAVSLTSLVATGFAIASILLDDSLKFTDRSRQFLYGPWTLLVATALLGVIATVGIRRVRRT